MFLFWEFFGLVVFVIVGAYCKVKYDHNIFNWTSIIAAFLWMITVPIFILCFSAVICWDFLISFFSKILKKNNIKQTATQKFLNYIKDHVFEEY